MIQAIGLGFLGGLLIGNGLPHFLRGITGERYPNIFGSDPVVNFLAGWTSLCLGVLAIAGAAVPAEPVLGGASIAVGVLLFGLFHAMQMAFGRD